MPPLYDLLEAIGDVFKELDARDNAIITFLYKYPRVTTKTVAEHLSMDEHDVARRIDKIRQLGLVKSDP
ncbi:MAG: MarR family transcriptional regulator [Candidatus Korarchaeota archaeon]|nr:MarR family transcriptional regulator [Candidatus Korarchaeota archaeon]NIU84731.1 hypothetical protein [Candidatus Thorarchaeota archaeon]NIW14733.1 hypothetical protein [Candidatus Thorarchaeota archaeon]NIW52807.1 hypothetical protein [Candidatus Korarchaeota archaeon]